MKKTKQADTHTCEWCRKDGLKVKAVYKHFQQYACEFHKDKIQIDDGHMSEGDRQSWGRLFP